MTETPMMRQYNQAKSEVGDALLLFRMGDFYELFNDDAEVASKHLGLAIAKRDKKNAIPMAGFPYHQLDTYLGKLIKAGFRVAVCEQVEDAQAAKGLVKREVTQVVTPGTITDQAILDPAESNYLAAIQINPKSKHANNASVAWVELSTGQFAAATLPEAKLADLLTRLNPKELLVREDQAENLEQLVFDTYITRRPKWAFAEKQTRQVLMKKFDVGTLDGLGFEDHESDVFQVAGSVIDYLNETQKCSLDHIQVLSPYQQNQFVEIDQASWRSLEISQTIRHHSRHGSLLGVIDRCVTPMGSRLLGIWIRTPLTSQQKIERRLDAVEETAQDTKLREGLRSDLKSIYDLQRLLAKVSTGRASPRDLSQIRDTLAILPTIKAKLTGRNSNWLVQMEADLDLCADLRTQLDQALSDDCPMHLRDGGIIREGYNKELDELRELAKGGKEWIAQYQQSIQEETGIPLKVGFNKVFGYYLEVTHTHRDKVPENFIRKQTLKNAERYITPELKEYEEKVLSADSSAKDLEFDLFNQIRELAGSHAARLLAIAEIVASIDVVTSLGQLAIEQTYCRPTLTPESTLEIVEGRHPVLDIVQPLGAFVPNDTALDEEAGFIHLITGPNMAGKSTYIRQVALITLMAQIGSFVPAKSATIGIVDQIFARVGASDELSRGQSTFMVEMTETARILNTASSRSLVILDEIGRGTSTYDGVSLAWAIVEYLHDHIGCRTLFATHYHELTELQQTFNGVRNWNVKIQEWEEKIVFLHKIVQGAADKSYGIQVAKLAGVPDWVNRRADQILKNLESQSRDDQEQVKSATSKKGSDLQLTLFEYADHPLLEKIRGLDTNHMTPIQALQVLGEMQTQVDPDKVPVNQA
jgi:DNA mismatch repair protein MutS